MYVCGVTPYDTTHLGHARRSWSSTSSRACSRPRTAPALRQNVTDVDESILQRAARDKVSWRDLGRREERAFLRDMRRLDWRKPDSIPHATREIPAMIKLAERLKRSGHAYEVPAACTSTSRRSALRPALALLDAEDGGASLPQADDARLDDPSRRSPSTSPCGVASATDRPGRVPLAAASGVAPRVFDDVRPASRFSDRHSWAAQRSRLPAPRMRDRAERGGARHENAIRRPLGARGANAPGGRENVEVGRNMVFVRDALKKTSPQALRLYLLDVHYRRAFDHDEERLARPGSAPTRSPSRSVTAGSARSKTTRRP